MANMFGYSGVDGQIDTIEELLSLYGLGNTGTQTIWAKSDIPALGQVGLGYAYNEEQWAVVAMGGLDAEFATIDFEGKSHGEIAEILTLQLIDLLADEVWRADSVRDALDKSIFISVSGTNGLIEDMLGESVSYGGSFLPFFGAEYVDPLGDWVHPPFAVTDWTMVPGRGLDVRTGLGFDFPDSTISTTKKFLGGGRTREEIYRSIAESVARSLGECFPAGTQVTLENRCTQPIEDISVGDVVASFSENSQGRRELTGKRVVRLFENVTDTWIELSNGLTVTPGHRFLASDGSFRSIEDILAGDGIVIDQDGHELEVTGEYIRYSEETAHRYEQSEMFVAQPAGATALEPELKKGWKTYNFEVEEFHTFEPANTNNLPINKQKTAA